MLESNLDEVSECAKTESSVIQELTHYPQPSVREKAQKLIYIINPDTNAPANTQNAPTNTQNSLTPDNTHDDDGIFAGLNVGSTTTPQKNDKLFKGTDSPNNRKTADNATLITETLPIQAKLQEAKIPKQPKQPIDTSPILDSSKVMSVGDLIGTATSSVNSKPAKSQTQLEKDLLLNMPISYVYQPNLQYTQPMMGPYPGYPPYGFTAYQAPTLFDSVPASKTGAFDFVREDTSKSSFNFIKDEINKQNKTTS